jgi:endoglucanase
MKMSVNMKKVISPLLAVIVMCGSFTACKAEAKEMRDLSASEYAQDMGVGWNLGNTMEAYWANESNKTGGSVKMADNVTSSYEVCWGAVVTTQEIIDGAKDAGFSTVRIPVYWGNMMEDDGTFTINECYFNRVEQIINYCLNDGLYAVINIHHYDGYIIENYSKDEAVEIAENLWTQIANRFKDYSDYLVFEGFNESLGSQREGDNLSEEELFDYVNEMNQTFVDAVRSTGGNNSDRLLIVSGYWTNIDKTTTDSFKMPADSATDKLMVSVHYIDNAYYWTNNIGGDEWLEGSKQQCELLKAAFTDKGIPVFVGECTSIYDSDRFAANAKYTESSECLSIILNMAVDYGFVPVLWDVNDNMYSRTEYKLKSDSDAEVIKAVAEKIKENAE